MSRLPRVRIYPKEQGCTRYLVQLGVHHAWVYSFTPGQGVTCAMDPDGLPLSHEPCDSNRALEIATEYLERKDRGEA